MCFLMPFDLAYTKKHGKMAINHMLITLSIILQSIITFVFWVFLWEDVYRRNQGVPLRVEYQVLLHSIPAVAALINFIITDVIFYRNHVYLVWTFEILYMTSNLILVRVFGNRPIYWFMTWQDPQQSTIVVLLFLTFGYFLMTSFVQFSEWLRGRNLPRIEQIKKNKHQ